ncbi:hypothetical protein GCM10010988_21500 [Cnuibacter physcomitrellae]|nr:hypothetical protein GCM10010988_21500 [Cnuibacter physcomitrellae]
MNTVGGNLISHLERQGGWSIVGLSRRGGVDAGAVRHVAVDLLDREGTANALAELTDMTHVFYAAHQDRPSWTELVAPNLAMLVNVVDAIEPMWPAIARFFELEVAPPLPMSLADVMADKEEVWNEMVARHGLRRTPYREVSSWQFGDFVFGWDYDVIADTSKSRRAGFHEYVDTEAMFLSVFQDLRDQRIIP